jgi:hypothetical protein
VQPTAGFRVDDGGGDLAGEAIEDSHQGSSFSNVAALAALA